MVRDMHDEVYWSREQQKAHETKKPEDKHIFNLYRKPEEFYDDWGGECGRAAAIAQRDDCERQVRELLEGKREELFVLIGKAGEQWAEYDMTDKRPDGMLTYKELTDQILKLLEG